MENIEYEKFTIKSYTKAALAELYGIRPATLARWIRPFHSELKEIGYKLTQKRFTSLQIELIISKIGIP